MRWGTYSIGEKRKIKNKKKIGKEYKKERDTGGVR